MFSPCNFEKDYFNFSSFPLYMMNRIFEKFTYDGFAKFEECSQLAQNISLRNHRLLFTVDVSKIVIMDEFVFLSDGKRCKHFSFEMCARMRFPPVEISFDFEYLTPNAYNFMKKLDIIKLTCNFPKEKEAAFVTDLLKNAKIQTLKMKTFPGERIEEFHHDTSNIDNVEVIDCGFLSPAVVNSIKARKSLTLSNVNIYANDIIAYLVKVRNGEKPIDTTFNNGRVSWADLLAITQYLDNNCADGDSGSWFLKNNIGKPVLHIDVAVYFHTVRFSTV